MAQDMAYDRERLCEQFGIGPSDDDADERLRSALSHALAALGAVGDQKKKRGAKRKWTAERAYEFSLDCVQAEVLYKRNNGSRPNKRQLAETIARLLPDKYGDADRVQTMLSGAHLRPLKQKKKEAVEMWNSMTDFETMKKFWVEKSGLSDIVSAKIAAAKLKIAKLDPSNPRAPQEARSIVQDALSAAFEEMRSTLLVMADGMRAIFDKMQKKKKWSKEHRNRVEKEFEQVMLHPIKVLEELQRKMLAGEDPPEGPVPTEEDQKEAFLRFKAALGSPFDPPDRTR
jgi:hypothetical protein